MVRKVGKSQNPCGVAFIQLLYIFSHSELELDFMARLSRMSECGAVFF